MTHTYLVVVDRSQEMLVALRFVLRRAKETNAAIALLKIVEPEAIETWGGVERAVMDEAFTDARKTMAAHEKLIEETLGRKPRTFYRKGERVKALLDVLESEKDLSTLVLAADTTAGADNPLIRYLTSEKGLRKLRLPLVIVPDICDHPEETEEA